MLQDSMPTSDREWGSVRATWDEARVEALGAPLIRAANAARIGLAVLLGDIPRPHIVYVTDVGAAILGHPKDTIVGPGAVSLLVPDASAPTGSVPPASAPPGLARETTVLAAAGHPVHIEVTVAPLDLDGDALRIIFFRDISARHQSIEALRRSEETFRKLIELAPDAVWINNGRQLLYVNSATVRMLGYDTVDSVLALSPLAIVHPDDHAPMIERSRQMMMSGQPMPPREYRIRRRDGSLIMTEVQSMPVDWEGGKAILGFARDVTARKEIEAELVRSDRLAALGTLLAGIAHEMNNPLAYVLLGIEQAFTHLDQMPVTTDTAALRKVLEEVHEGATRVTGVVRQLRVTARTDVPEEGAVDVTEALRAALRVAGNELRHRAKLVTSLEELPPIAGSAQRLEQVFLNLLLNAAQALPEGRAENEIRINLRKQGDEFVIVEIADNGNGIPPEQLPRIFDPFFTTKAVGVGMGLGLSICHSIVTMHEGTIDVESEPGQGTLFRVVLPLRRRAVPQTIATELSAPIPAQAGRRLRVLVIDDEPTLGAVIRRLLAADCDVDVATNGREGLDILSERGADYDTILCDLMMPQMTGMELHGRIVETHPRVARRFVFMTGGAFTPRAADFLANTRAPQLDKPFDLATLREAIKLQ